MKRTQTDNVVTPRYSYGEIESALGAVFGLDSKIQRGALRGRLKHFQKLDWPGIKAGKGARIRYTREQGDRMLIALLMSQVGIDPVITAKFAEQYWPRLKREIGKAADGESRAGNFVWLHLRPALMTTTWTGEAFPQWIRVFRRWNPPFTYTPTPAPPGATGVIGGIPKINPPSSANRWAMENVTPLLEPEIDEWVCLRNLSRVAIRFDDALKKGVSDGRP